MESLLRASSNDLFLGSFGNKPPDKWPQTLNRKILVNNDFEWVYSNDKWVGEPIIKKLVRMVLAFKIY